MDSLNLQSNWEKLIDKWVKRGYETLLPSERIWFNVRSLIDSVDNGGLISYYYNSGADYLEETVEDLYKLKAYEVINIINQVNELFQDDKPPIDIDRRNNIISSWDGKNDELLEELDRQFYQLEEDLEAKLEPVIKMVVFKKE